MMTLIDIPVTEMGLSAVASGTSNVIGPGRASRVKEWIFYAKYGAGTSAGVVTVETSDDPADAGTWASIGTIPWTAASKMEKLTFVGILKAVRLRISTNVVGGTVTCSAAGRG